MQLSTLIFFLNINFVLPQIFFIYVYIYIKKNQIQAKLISYEPVRNILPGTKMKNLRNQPSQ